MEVDSEVWIKGKETKKNANDGSWTIGKVVSKDISLNGVVTITVRDESGHDFMFSSNKGGLDLEEIQLKNIDTNDSLDNLIELPYLNEPEILRSLSSRYFERKIYTYTGNILIAINPLQTVVPDETCEAFMRQYSGDVKTAAVGVADRVKSKIDPDSDEIRRHSIIISGESGSGKTECAKLLTMFLIEAAVKSSSDLVGIRAAHGDDSDDDTDFPESSSNRDRTLSQDSIMNFSPLDDSRSSRTFGSAFSPDRQRSPKSSSRKSRPAGAQSTKHRGGAGFFSAYQLSTMERIRQITPILEAFGNACIEHTHNSSRLGKYIELAFTKRGELVGGEIRTYLLENVRVIKQQIKERNFHIFYQLVAGASEEERNSYALSSIEDYFYTNQGGKDVLSNPLVNDKQAFVALKEHFADLGFDSGSVQNILQVVGGILHLGQIEFTFTTQLEGQVAEVLEKLVANGKESELAVAARLCSLSVEELERSLTRRSVLLNKETFHKALTPLQAVNARDAIAKVVYKRLFNFLVQEVNSKLRPTQELPAAVSASVGILDIFGFDSFAVNSFEQLCINYANEALQQHFSQNMFKLEIIEYKREGIPFEDIEFPDNQDSLDLITNGVFTILDDQCRIPNATDKRLASQFYKELTSNSKFSASLPQVSAGHFCVHHFAGPVVYTTDNFVDKNLDQLPQDAAELLKSSLNPVLQFDVDVQVAGGRSNNLHSVSTDELPPPAMAAYITRPKAAPEATNVKGLLSPTGARMPRRGSIGKAVPFSVVAQLRSELSIMMAHINTTTPHYVCCVNPMERSSTAHETARSTTDRSAHFQSHIVAEQLRYGGILSAVKVARSGLPNRFHFLDFYQRYRCVANPLFPGTASLPLFLTEKDDESVVKAHCETLVLSLTNQSDAPVVVSVLQARLEEEMQAVFRKRSVRHWMGSIGGVINQGNAAVGVTKVFLGKHAHTVLESCLYHQLALCRNKIADLVLKFAAKKRLARTLRVIRVVQRVMRGALARARTRALRTQKAAMASVKVATPVAAAVVSGTREVRSFAAQVATYKQQDLTIQEQIKKLVNSNKVDEDEPEFITIDFPAVKAELLTYAGKFSNSSVINVKTTEASDALAEGYTLLRAEKLIPLTAVGKALNFGRSAKSDNRTSSVKSANKVITKDHSMFKTMHKLMDRLRELFELAKLEKDVLETRKRNKNTRPNSLISPMRRASITTGDSSSQKNDPEAAEIDMKMITLDKVAKLSRTLYQFYHQYIMQIVKEFGYESKYKTSFADDNQYLLGFTTLVESQKPLLSFEKPKTQTSGAQAQSAETPVAAEDSQSASKSFPLYIPGEDQQGPQHKGYAPLCTYGGVHFKVLPANHAPGVEYAFNCLHRLLDGAHLMYPIKYLKMIGKSGEGKGKETYYQAAMEFGSQSLATVGPAGASKIVLDDFSAAFVASVLFGAKSLYPEHLQVHTADGKVHLKGFNVDDDLLCQLFKYYGGHTHSGALTPGGGGPASPGSPMVHASDLNILYMLPLMDAPISPAVVALLTAATAAPSLTSSWLKDLHMQNRRYGVLKAVGFTPTDLTNLSLPIALPVHAAAQIQHMLVKISKALSQGVANGLPLTHSDLLAALEAGTAEKYAELRIQTAKVSPFELFETHRARIVPAKPSAPQGKATLTMAVDTMTAEVLNTLDFTSLSDSAELEAAYAALFDNFSYLPSLHLRNISEAQLKLLFSKILEVNKQAFERQKSFRTATTAPPASAKPEPVRPSVRTTVKTLVVCGLTQQAAKALHTSSVVHAIQQELGIKVSFDITLGKKPVFLFGSTPPREGTTVEKAKESCAKFAARSAVLAIDGFIVYDIQDEGGRTTMERPFPFRKTMDPSLYASFFPAQSGKQCVVYKCVVENSMEDFDQWLTSAIKEHGHTAFNFVGAASSSVQYAGPTLQSAGLRSLERGDCKFGCVTIPERHTSKGNEDENMIRKSQFGAEWFITQGIFAAGPLVTMLNSYGDKCKARGLVPKKVVLTFAPCGRAKTMTFIKWLGMHVPEEVQQRILTAENPVKESMNVLCEILKEVLLQTAGSGVPLGINVESLSIFKEEIDGAHELFQKLQAILLNSSGSPWSVRWFYVDKPLRRKESIDETHAADALARALAQVEAYKQSAENNKSTDKTSSAVTCPTSCSASCVLAATVLVALSFAAGRYTSK